MPAFTFEKISPEKISPSARHESTAADPRSKQPGAIVQMLGRLTEISLQRKTSGLIAGNEGVLENQARD